VKVLGDTSGFVKGRYCVVGRFRATSPTQDATRGWTEWGKKRGPKEKLYYTNRGLGGDKKFKYKVGKKCQLGEGGVAKPVWP